MRTLTKTERKELRDTMRKYVSEIGISRVAAELGDIAYDMAKEAHVDYCETMQDSDLVTRNSLIDEYLVLSTISDFTENIPFDLRNEVVGEISGQTTHFGDAI